MSDDLVKRLTQKDYGDVPIGALDAMSDAAARIEKLEAALRDLSDGWECCPVSKAMRSVARKALEGKDD